MVCLWPMAILLCDFASNVNWDRFNPFTLSLQCCIRGGIVILLLVLVKLVYVPILSCVFYVLNLFLLYFSFIFLYLFRLGKTKPLFIFENLSIFA